MPPQSRLRTSGCPLNESTPARPRVDRCFRLRCRAPIPLTFSDDTPPDEWRAFLDELDPDAIENPEAVSYRDRQRAPRHPAYRTSDESEENGWGLWASVTTDGIPENAAMRSLLVGNVHGALAFLFALVVTNGSQSMMSGTNMKENRGGWLTMGAWIVTATVVGGAVLLGYWLLPPLPNYWLGAVRAFAGGAILASLAGEIYPDAYDETGPYITLATAVGFLGTFLL